MSKLIFKNIIAFIIFFTLASVRVNSQDRVGINNDNPQATLDIKSDNDDRDKVMRITGNFADSNNDDAVFFVGKISGQNQQEVHDLRKMTPEEFGNKISAYIPSLNTVTIVNSGEQTFTGNKYGGNNNIGVQLDKQVVNTNSGMFYFVENHNAIEITQAGEYNISAFVGFKQIKSYEGDMIVSIAINKYDATTNSYPGGWGSFTNYKRNVISRSSGANYTVNSNIKGAGIGASFSFTNQFNAHDRVKIQVNKVFYGEVGNPVIGVNGANLTITRVTPTVNLNQN